MKKRLELDDTDLRILEALDQMGAKVSTRELAKELGMNDRTIRYRLKKLRERKILYPACVQTHERKIGLGETIILLDAVIGLENRLEELVNKIDCFYWHCHTIGQYNGFMIHAVYPITAPSSCEQILKEIKKKGLINKYYMFDLVDYEVKKMDFSRYDLSSGWKFDWKEWYKDINKTMKSKVKSPLNLDLQPHMIDFDIKDVQIMRFLLENPEGTMKELASDLSLSETQVSKRMKRLEKSGLIKGIRPVVRSLYDELFISLFIEVDRKPDQIITCFYKLPFKMGFAVESPMKLRLGIAIGANEFDPFMQGFDLMRPYLSSYFIQIQYKFKQSQAQFHYDNFNPETKRWELPIAKYIQTVKDFKI